MVMWDAIVPFTVSSVDQSAPAPRACTHHAWPDLALWLLRVGMNALSVRVGQAEQ